jgi:hypothetical protein
VKYLNWDTIRRGAGLLFLAYLVFINPADIPIWVGALIAGLLGFPEVVLAQFGVNQRYREIEVEEE